MIDTSWGEMPARAAEDDEKVQGSPAWLSWRGKGLGSSDAAVLLGWSPWKDVGQLWQEKLGLWKPTFGPQQQSAMDRGKELEPKIRAWYEASVGARFKEDTEEHGVHKFLRASYDGINRELKRVLEIKAPNAKDHALAGMGEIPEKYRAQCEWLMMVSGLKELDYVSFGTDGKYHVVRVDSDPALQAELLRRALLFWQHVGTKVEPAGFERWSRPLDAPVALPDAPEETRPTPEEQDVEALVAAALKVKEEADAASARYEALRDRLKAVVGDAQEMVRGEAVFGWQERKGVVQYKNIPELIGLDLEQFRGKPTRAFYFKRRGTE